MYFFFFFFSSRRRHTRFKCDWSSDVCSSDLTPTVKVSLIVILVTLPGLVVPPFGGVLIDRVDRRYLGITLDASRAVIVLGTAALAYVGRLAIWELYSMVFLLGVGFAVYWSTTNALVQELVPREQLLTANATVLIAVQCV